MTDNFADFVKAFSNFGSGMVELAHLTGDRQNVRLSPFVKIFPIQDYFPLLSIFSCIRLFPFYNLCCLQVCCLYDGI